MGTSAAPVDPAPPVTPPAPPADPTPATPPAPPANPAAPVDPAAPPAPPVTPPADPAPVTYALTLPADTALDPAVVERTTAIASALKLSPDHAQQVLGLVAQEATAHAKAAVAADLQSRLPGGKVWEQQNTTWKQEALAHPELGGGKPEQLDANAALAKRVIATFGGSDAATMDKFLVDSGLASHPATLGLLVRIGKAMREDQLVVPSSTIPNTPKDIGELLYGGTK